MSLEIIWNSLNIGALLGWVYLLFLTWTLPSDLLLENTKLMVNVLESICIIEVIRIGFGTLPGNLLFGSLLHLIRVIVWFIIIPQSKTIWIRLILGIWSMTEVSRYPMYIFKRSKYIRLLRMLIPLLSFPLGCFCEAFAAYSVYSRDQSLWVQISLIFLLCINGILGPSMAYPHVLQKGRRELNRFRKDKES